jgi:hypothetical protein
VIAAIDEGVAGLEIDDPVEAERRATWWPQCSPVEAIRGEVDDA